MDKFAVDIDKVLDEFEEIEFRSKPDHQSPCYVSEGNVGTSTVVTTAKTDSSIPTYSALSHLTDGPSYSLVNASSRAQLFSDALDNSTNNNNVGDFNSPQLLKSEPSFSIATGALDSQINSRLSYTSSEEFQAFIDTISAPKRTDLHRENETPAENVISANSVGLTSCNDYRIPALPRYSGSDNTIVQPVAISTSAASADLIESRDFLEATVNTNVVEATTTDSGSVANLNVEPPSSTVDNTTSDVSQRRSSADDEVLCVSVGDGEPVVQLISPSLSTVTRDNKQSKETVIRDNKESKEQLLVGSDGGVRPDYNDNCVVKLPDGQPRMVNLIETNQVVAESQNSSQVKKDSTTAKAGSLETVVASITMDASKKSLNAACGSSNSSEVVGFSMDDVIVTEDDLRELEALEEDSPIAEPRVTLTLQPDIEQPSSPEPSDYHDNLSDAVLSQQNVFVEELPKCNNTSSDIVIEESRQLLPSSGMVLQSQEDQNMSPSSPGALEASPVVSGTTESIKRGVALSAPSVEQQPVATTQPGNPFEEDEVQPQNPFEGDDDNEETPSTMNVTDPPTATPALDNESSQQVYFESNQNIYTPDVQSASGIDVNANNDNVENFQSDLSSMCTEEQMMLGNVKPYWVQDEEAGRCMNCNAEFTIFRRRHHCRACGRVFCASCCNSKAKLAYMDFAEARVCSGCIVVLEQGASGVATFSPNPNNPYEYCSTIPPLQQMGPHASDAPPTVFVPVGVLKRPQGGEQSSSGRLNSPKSVMFSDGIRPGGDLAESAGESSDFDIPSAKPPKRLQKRVSDVGRTVSSAFTKPNKVSIGSDLPPVILTPDFPSTTKGVARDVVMKYIDDCSLPPVIFALTKNLHVLVKCVTLDCCAKSRCWVLCSRGMCAVGQDEIAFVLERTDSEEAIHPDVFRVYATALDAAAQSNPVSALSHILFPDGLFGNRQNSGVLFIRPTLQCLKNIPFPIGEPVLVGVLIQRWEVPWAKLFPLRLLLRLGAEFRYYPCPLISVQDRKPVYEEVGHTIMNLLADFRNYQYTLVSIPGLYIKMQERTTIVDVPRTYYDMMCKALSANEHILAFGGAFCEEADAHLVCVQSEDGSYQSQAINILHRDVKTTAASFLVFSGALKSSSGVTGKWSIVEDGVMVQIPPQTLDGVRAAIKDMRDISISCRPLNKTDDGNTTAAPVDEDVVHIRWYDGQADTPKGVLSGVDGRDLGGVAGARVLTATDYAGEAHVIRWTHVYFLRYDNNRWADAPDPQRITDAFARALCLALLPHAPRLYEGDKRKISLRIRLESDQVGYEVGSGGELLSGELMSDLDELLVPLISSAPTEASMIVELLFYVLLK